MNLRIRTFFLFTLALSVNACTFVKEKQSAQLKTFIESKSINYAPISSVLVITEDGCPQCNFSFAKLMEEQKDNEHLLYIISAKGTTVDISGLFNFKNVIKDYKGEFKTLDISNKSCCIFLTPDQKIDTLIELKITSLESDLEYIEKRLD